MRREEQRGADGSKREHRAEPEIERERRHAVALADFERLTRHLAQPVERHGNVLAERAAALRWDEAATRSIEQALDARWDESLATRYGTLPVAGTAYIVVAASILLALLPGTGDDPVSRPWPGEASTE